MSGLGYFQFYGGSLVWWDKGGKTKGQLDKCECLRLSGGMCFSYFDSHV